MPRSISWCGLMSPMKEGGIDIWVYRTFIIFRGGVVIQEISPIFTSHDKLEQMDRGGIEELLSIYAL